jgi:hypothetical protein
VLQALDTSSVRGGPPFSPEPQRSKTQRASMGISVSAVNFSDSADPGHIAQPEDYYAVTSGGP